MNIKKEIPIITVVALPFIYLAYIWNKLPEKVPIHWNIKGEIDRFGNKSELLLIPILLPLLIYIILLIIPKIDPKNRIRKMCNKYQQMKILLTTFMSILALFIIYSAKNQSFANNNYIVLLIGLVYIILGNYLKFIKVNYFIGIRTPWTLESEIVWEKTQKLGGKIWFIGGILIVFLSLLLDKQLAFILFIIITVIIIVTPVIYSYLLYKKIVEKV